MIFSSFTFLLLFMPGVLLLYRVMPARLRMPCLLAASLLFYGWGNPAWLLLIAWSMVLNWGGEYELLFTFPKEDIEALQRTGVFFSIIGHITGDDGAYIIREEKKRRLDYGRY